jgi:hypothetical protein
LPVAFDESVQIVGGVAYLAADLDIADLPALAKAAQRFRAHREQAGGLAFRVEQGGGHSAIIAGLQRRACRSKNPANQRI